MAETTLRIRANRAWIDGRFRPAEITVIDGVLARIDRPEGGPRGCFVVPDDAVLLPGLVDSHVHVNEPGRTEWEGFASATLAAAAGGVTTLVDMPLNSVPPTTTVHALTVKRAAAQRSAYVDVGFWGGAVPENLAELGPLHEAGVFGFKCFLAPSGVEEFGYLTQTDLRHAMAEIARLNSRLLVHAEDPAHLHDHAIDRSYTSFLRSRPRRSESSAIDMVIDVARHTGARVHILHLSDAGSLASIRQAKADGVQVTVETCPHYLTLTAEEIPDGAFEFKCCPPIREAANRDQLWAGVLDGTIDGIVSDHSPSTVEIKQGTGAGFGDAWGGISGLQLGMSAVWTEAQRRGVPLDTLIPLFTTGPASIAGLTDAGRLTVGAPAHLTVFGPGDLFMVNATRLRHRNPISAYDGRTMIGRTRRTWLRGQQVFDITEGGAGHAAWSRRPPAGQLLSTPTTAPANATGAFFARGESVPTS